MRPHPWQIRWSVQGTRRRRMSMHESAAGSGTRVKRVTPLLMLTDSTVGDCDVTYEPVAYHKIIVASKHCGKTISSKKRSRATTAMIRLSVKYGGQDVDVDALDPSTTVRASMPLAIACCVARERAMLLLRRTCRPTGRCSSSRCRCNLAVDPGLMQSEYGMCRSRTHQAPCLSSPSVPTPRRPCALRPPLAPPLPRCRC